MTLYIATSDGTKLPNTTSTSATGAFMCAVFHGYKGELNWKQITPKMEENNG